MQKLDEFRIELKKPKVIAGLVFISLLILMKFAWFPWLDWRADKVDYIEQQRNNIRPVNVITEAHETVNQQLILIRERFKEVKRNYFVGTANELEISIQRLVDKLSVKNLVKINNRSAQSGTESDVLNVLQMDIIATGPLNGIEQFIHELENNTEKVLIDSIVIQKVGRYKDELRLTLKLRSYSVVGDKEIE